VEGVEADGGVRAAPANDIVVGGARIDGDELNALEQRRTELVDEAVERTLVLVRVREQEPPRGVVDEDRPLR